MGSLRKSFAVILILIVAVYSVSLLTAKSACAQSTPAPTVPTPAVPTFTVKPVGPPTIVNTTYSLDPNTGKIVAQIGYTNEYSAVNITIKNQHVSLFNQTYFYYNVQLKLHDSAIWITNIYPLAETDYPLQSNSEYTVLSFTTTYLSQYFEAYYNISLVNGAEIDIQVEALIGKIVTVGGFPQGTEFDGQTSGWSNTQTVTLPANVPLSPTPAPSSSSSTPTLTPASSASNALLLLTVSVALIVIAFLLAVIIALLLYVRKRNRLIGLDKT
jgi:hypothetical protein